MSKRFRREGSPWSLRYVEPDYFVRLSKILGVAIVVTVIAMAGMYFSRVDKGLTMSVTLAIGPAFVLFLAARMRRWWEAPFVAFVQYTAALATWLGCRIQQVGWDFGTARIDWEVVLTSGVASPALCLIVWIMTKIIRGTPIVEEWRCAKCAYSLVGNTSGRCPECGTTVAKITAH